MEPGVGAAMCHSGISLVQIDENWTDFNSGDKKLQHSDFA